MYEFTRKPYCQNSQMGICPLHCCDCTPLDCMYHHGNLVGARTPRHHWHCKRDDRIVWFDMDEYTVDEVVEDILHRIEAA